MSQIDELREAVRRLERRIRRLERKVAELSSNPGGEVGLEVLMEEDGYMLVRNPDILGGYIVITPEGEHYTYAKLEYAKKVLENLKSQSSQ